MMKATVTRLENTSDGVLGEFKLFDHQGHEVLHLHTLEDDWKNNQPSESCIPDGNYICKRDVWHKKQIVVFQITGVPHRDRILIHFGNTEEDVKGCIVVGLSVGTLSVKDEDDPAHPQRTKRAVLQSRPAFEKLMAALTTVDSFDLTISWAPGVKPVTP